MTLSARLPRLARGNGRRSFVLGTALVLFSDSVERQKVFVAVTEADIHRKGGGGG